MFDEIRPYNPEELPEVYERLLADRQFLAVLPYVLPDVPVEQVAAMMRSCKTNLEFQKMFKKAYSICHFSNLQKFNQQYFH